MDRSRCTRSNRHPGRKAAAAAASSAGGGPVAPIDERTSGMQKIDGYFPLYWDERTGSLLLEIPQLRHRVPLLDRPRRRPRIERHRPRSRPGGGGPRRQVPARRAARDAGAAELHVPRRAARMPPSASRSRTRSRNRSCGASPSPPRPTAACWSTPPTSSCATSRTPAARCGPAPIASIARAARSTCRAPRASRRTPRST